MSQPVHPPTAPPARGTDTPTGTLDKLPGTGKVFTQSTTGNSVVDAAINAVGNFVGVGVGLVFITIGIVIIVLSNEKVQDVGRKVTGAAAALNPELAGAAIATNVITGKKARAENINQVMAAPARKARQAAAAAKKAAPKPTPAPKPVKPVRQSFSVPVVKTRTVPEQRSARDIAMPTNTRKYLPGSPRIERPE